MISPEAIQAFQLAEQAFGERMQARGALFDPALGVEAGLLAALPHLERIEADESAVPVGLIGQLEEWCNEIEASDMEALAEDGPEFAPIMAKGNVALRIRRMIASAHPPAQMAKPPQLGGCCCGEPCTLGVVHRTDGPCFHYVEPAQAAQVDEPIGYGLWHVKDKRLGGFVYSTAEAANLQVSPGYKVIPLLTPAAKVGVDFCQHGREWTDYCYDEPCQRDAQIAPTAEPPTHPHSPDAADSGRVTDEQVSAAMQAYIDESGIEDTRAGEYLPIDDEAMRAAITAALAAQGRSEACSYCNGSGDVHSIDGEWRGECTECPAAMEREFKNFHRQLCERFGYTHDEKDWRRDQVSLIEHIAMKLPASPAVVPDGWMVVYKYWDGWPLHIECQTGNQNGPTLAPISDMEKSTCTKCGKPMLAATPSAPDGDA